MHGIKTPKTRLGGSSDLQGVAALFDAYRQFYEQPPDRELAMRFIEERMRSAESVILVTEGSSGEITGFCQMYPSFCSVEAAKIVTLYDLYVAPQSRQQGVGRALLLAAETYARDHGYVRMDLTTAKTNVLAQSVYESLGWVRDEIFLTYSRRISDES